MKLRMIVLQARSQVPTLTELFQWMDQWEWKEQLEMGHDNFSIEVTGPYTSPVTDDPQRGRRNYFLVYEPGMWTARSVFTLLFHTPWSRVLLEKLTGSQLDKKFPAFYGTWRFITVFTSARHLSLSWASSIHSITPHPTSRRSILILSSHLRLGLPSGSFPQVSPPKPCMRLSSHPWALHAQPISFFSILSPEQYWVTSTEVFTMKIQNMEKRPAAWPRKRRLYHPSYSQ